MIAASPPTCPKRKPRRKRCAKDTLRLNTSKPFWWRRIPVNIEDPITLQPLRKLPFPPFNLQPMTAGTNGSQPPPCWFDPVSLSSYLISSLNFYHPISRRPLTRDECHALDRHINAHCTAQEHTMEAARAKSSPQPSRASVCWVFDNRKEGLSQSQVADMQRDATMILESLFEQPFHNRPAQAPELPAQAPSSTWGCPSCTFLNSASQADCEICDCKKPAEADVDLFLQREHFPNLAPQNVTGTAGCHWVRSHTTTPPESQDISAFPLLLRPDHNRTSIQAPAPPASAWNPAHRGTQVAPTSFRVGLPAIRIN